MTKMPALYLGHGAPILLEDELWTSQLANWSKQLEKPKAILIVSAHWESAPITLSNPLAGTPLVYDFSGFDQKFYEMSRVRHRAASVHRGRYRVLEATYLHSITK